jgi:hypothetical protein
MLYLTSCGVRDITNNDKDATDTLDQSEVNDASWRRCSTKVLDDHTRSVLLTKAKEKGMHLTTQQGARREIFTCQEVQGLFAAV